jgi:arsenite methyltransferase
MQIDAYAASIEAAGLRVVHRRVNPEHRFVSANALGASRKHGVKSISLLASMP